MSSLFRSIHARQILDSRSNPTVEVDVVLEDGSAGRASVPSGASTGMYEAVELRDGDAQHYQGKGVEQAVEWVNTAITNALQNNDPFDQQSIDAELVMRDGTTDSSRFGANAILGVSLAISKAASQSRKLPYYQYIRYLFQQVCLGVDAAETSTTSQPFSIPCPMFNVINGGAHTNWQSTDCQEFMVVPHGAASFSEQLEWGSEIYVKLKELLAEKGHHTTVGDEGGFAPTVSDEEAIQLVLEAIRRAGFEAGRQVSLGLDPATSEWWQDGGYTLRLQKQRFTSAQLVTHWQSWTDRYPIFSLEDGLAENDWTGWQQLTEKLSSRCLIVGDDLLVTNTDKIQQAIQQRACTALLMKVNQIGTLTQSLQAICLARKAGWQVIVSHRSGETEDTTIADVAVGTNSHYMKSGAPARSERLSKYNQLLRIEEELTLPSSASTRLE